MNLLNASQKSSVSQFFARRLWSLLATHSVLACVITVAGYCGDLWWPVENLSCFRVQYALCLSLAGILFLVGKRRRWAYIATSFALLNCFSFVPLYFGKPESTGAPELRVMSVNVHTSNRQYEKLFAAIRAENPHVVFMMEIDAQWANQTRQLEKEFPYFKRVPRSDNFGIGFFSRIKPEEIQVRYLGDADVPTVVAKFIIANKSLNVVGTHPVPPVRAEYVQFRNEQLSLIGDVVSSNRGEALLIGDLNCSSESTPFRSLLKKTGMHDSRQGFGVQPSWPANMFFMYTTIDHCLVSPGMIVHNRRVGSDVGSDHYPVIVDVSFRIP